MRGPLEGMKLLPTTAILVLVAPQVGADPSDHGVGRRQGRRLHRLDDGIEEPAGRIDQPQAGGVGVPPRGESGRGVIVAEQRAV